MPSACCYTVSPAIATSDALGANRNSAHSVVQDRRTDSPNRSLYPHSPGQRLAFSRTLPSRLALRLLLVRLDCLTTHLRKGQAELSLKTILEVRKDDLRTVGGAPTRTQTCPTSAMGFLRYDFSC